MRDKPSPMAMPQRLALLWLWLVLVTAAVLVGPLLSPFAVDAIDFDAAWSQPPSLHGGHWWGTDSLGRDLWVRCLVGGRISLWVALAASALALALGVGVGAAAALTGGWIDALLMRGVDVLYAVPYLFLVLLLSLALGRSPALLVLAIGLTHWLDTARLVRSALRGMLGRDFVLAARLGGERGWHLLWRSLLPNLAPTVLLCLSLTLPQAILAESFLSFLGLGIAEPDCSWGSLIQEGARQLEAAPHALLFPVALLLLTLLAAFTLADAAESLPP